MDIKEGNILIAKFMGRIPKLIAPDTYAFEDAKKCGYFNTPEEALDFYAGYASYHDSWDWIIRVLEKIGQDTEYELVIRYGDAYWNRHGENPLPSNYKGYGFPMKEGIWKAVVDFIKWQYNKNN